jgi:hypothetical protein
MSSLGPTPTFLTVRGGRLEDMLEYRDFSNSAAPNFLNSVASRTAVACSMSHLILNFLMFKVMFYALNF